MAETPTTTIKLLEGYKFKAEFNQEMTQLDGEFRGGKIEGDDYVQKRMMLKGVKDSLKEECSRMGVIPP